MVTIGCTATRVDYGYYSLLLQGLTMVTIVYYYKGWTMVTIVYCYKG